MRFNLACKCGAHWQGNCPGDVVVQLLAVEWKRQHQGDGHGPCTPREAGRIRVKTENQRLKEERSKR